MRSEVQIFPGPPFYGVDYRGADFRLAYGRIMEKRIGALAQMGERLLCKQDVIGSIPIGSTNPAAPEP